MIFLSATAFFYLVLRAPADLILNQVKTIKAQKDLAVLMSAVLKFKARYGALPFTLEYLTQGEHPILKELPVDPFPGADPSRHTYYYGYTFDGQGFYLYSCGPNAKNDCDISNYREPERVSRSLGSGEDPEDCDDIIVSNMPIKNR